MKNYLLDEVKKSLAKSDEKNTVFFGSKPKEERSFIKFKRGLVAGIGVGLLSAFPMMGMQDYVSMNKVEVKKVVVETRSYEGKISQKMVEEPMVEAPVLKKEYDDSLLKMEKEYGNVDFSKIKNQRDVSRAFLGKNNFIALASEMEGFRGDLHKDPAVGLNIGFGYNITKRVQASKTEVVKDLLSIGIDEERVFQLVEMSQLPQNKLAIEIKKFNAGVKNSQLIDIRQGVALLLRTQEDYRNQARASFADSFDKMGKNQQEVLTYAAYKAGYEALSKYKKAIKAANTVYASDKEKGVADFKLIAKEITFYYQKDGKEWVLDERASLIALAFMNPDYLAVQIGSYDAVKTPRAKLESQKIDFSHMPVSLSGSFDIEKTRKSFGDKPADYQKNKMG